mmetsp:Transcript_27325/g.64002  ORF Transcript_27325/g.64002 Transcript_27325/m.64002 type:complete len:91 (-) Transcript_27325:88-360(-)
MNFTTTSSGMIAIDSGICFYGLIPALMRWDAMGLDGMGCDAVGLGGIGWDEMDLPDIRQVSAVLKDMLFSAWIAGAYCTVLGVLLGYSWL